jgi:hypothetical protein
MWALLAVLLAQPAFAAEDPAKQQAERQLAQPLNNAPIWREVRKATTRTRPPRCRV